MTAATQREPFLRADRPIVASAALILAFCSTAALMLFYSASSRLGAHEALASNAYVGIYICAALICCFVARVSPARTVRWEYLAVGIISVPIAIVVGGQSEALGDLIALAFYAAVAAALTPPRRLSHTPHAALRWMDIVLIGIGVTTLIAYAAFLAIVEQSPMRPGLYQPLAPAAAVFVLLPAALTFRWRENWLSNSATIVLFSGLAIAITADLGTAQDVNRFLWAGAVWLMAMGATLALRGERQPVQAPSIDVPSWWPAAAAGAVYALVASAFWRIQPIGTRILVIGGTAATFLLLARQIVALRDNRRLLARLALFEKREAVSRATADVAHEFNNLLTAMTGHIEILERELRGNHSNGATVRELRQVTADAVALTRSLLGAARPSAAQDAIVDVNAVVQQVVSMFQPSVGGGRALRVNLSVEPCLTRGEIHALGHALLNLLINARDATPDRGTIQIETQVVAASSVPVALPLRRADHIRVTIQDSGIGMTGEVLARAFDPFFTTKRDGQGTGLGLAIVLSTVRHHGGMVDVHSAPGQGSSFSMWLPRA